MHCHGEFVEKTVPAEDDRPGGFPIHEEGDVCFPVGEGVIVPGQQVPEELDAYVHEPHTPTLAPEPYVSLGRAGEIQT